MTRSPVLNCPPGTATTISREALSELPIRRYEGPVHLVVEPADVERPMLDFWGESVVGVDTETRPAFRVGERYLPSLVQFATGSAVYLMQVQQQDHSALLREVLGSERVVKAGISVTDDLRRGRG